MKKHTKLIIAGASLVSILVLVGCEKSVTATDLMQTTSEVSSHHISDEDISKKVEMQLRNDELLYPLVINVVTRKGDVMLTGEVDEPNKLAYVDKLVMSIEGVHSVHNHLTVRDSKS